MRSLFLLLLPSLALAQIKTAPGDWPQWRGPDRTGVSAEKDLLKAWPKGGPKLLWSAANLGEGYTAPSVAGGKVYLMGAISGEEYVFALDTSNAKRRWTTKIGKVGINRGPKYPGPRSTPTVEGDYLWTLGSDGDLVCLKTDTGKLVWRKHFEKDYKGIPGYWSYGESVLIDGDHLLCTPGGPVATILCLNKTTGKEVWKTPIEEANAAAYASLMPMQVGKTKIYVQFLGAALIGVDARTGKLLWKYRKNVGGVNCSTPIIHNGHIFTSAGGNDDAGGDALLKISETAKGVEMKQVYYGEIMKCFHGGVIRVGDHVYGCGRNGLVCLEFKTGKLAWKHRSIGGGSLVAADGHLYLRNSAGDVALIEANPKKYVEKARFRQAKRSKFATFAHPVIAQGRLYLRDAEFLHCYELKSK